MKVPVKCVKRLGWCAFAFFLVKGLAWLALPLLISWGVISRS